MIFQPIVICDCPVLRLQVAHMAAGFITGASFWGFILGLFTLGHGRGVGDGAFDNPSQQMTHCLPGNDVKVCSARCCP